MTGDVTWLDEPEGDDLRVTALAERVREELLLLRRAALGQDEPDLPDDDRLLSYAVPQTVPLDVADRQALLESTDTESRLRLGLSLVHREREFATALGAVSQPPHPPMNLN